MRSTNWESDILTSDVSCFDDQLSARLLRQLQQPLPGWVAQAPFAPELSYGRHAGPVPADARQAAVLALLYPHQGAWHIPLTVRPTTMHAHAGQISLPGGTTELGEASFECALRELTEELGVSPDRVELLGSLTPLYLFVSNFVITPWIGVARKRPDWVPNPFEVAELLEIPLAHLIDSRNRGSHARQHRGLSLTVPHLQWGRHRIWGATSMILGEFAAVVREAHARKQADSPDTVES